MRYTFKDISNTTMYSNTKVMFVLGKYTWFNNIVCDTLKEVNMTKGIEAIPYSELDAEYGFEDTNDEYNSGLVSVNFNTFMDVIDTPNINGKWLCVTDISLLDKKQQTVLDKYLKNPSNNGLLIITSTEWKDFRYWLKNKTLSVSIVSNLIQLSFPSIKELKHIVKKEFESYGISIANDAVDFFVLKMGSAYDKYNENIKNIVDTHNDSILTKKVLQGYMKGIEYYDLNDFVVELTKPMASSLTNSKKVLKIMGSLIDEMGAKSLIYKLLNIIDECIEYRILINDGFIPIGINYFFGDVIKKINNEKYEKVKEWTFRKKADLASLTSLRDWQYMKMILRKPIDNVMVSEDIMDMHCKRALYDVATRSVLTESRINNIIGIEDIMDNGLNSIDKIKLEYK